MSNLVINNHLIDAPIIDILKRVKSELTNGKLGEIQQKTDYVRVTCPLHKEGHESHPSCSVYCGDGELEYGYAHCMTCDYKGHLWDFIAKCFDETPQWGKEWLIENFGETYVTSSVVDGLTDIDLGGSNEKSYLDESILSSFESYHPYMKQRGLSDEIIKQFEIKYDSKLKTIVFPVRDKHGKLVALTRRSVEGKRFIIDKDFDKSNIYLLYDIIQNDTKEVYVAESQINALVLRSWGFPSIALFGAGTTYKQMQELNKTGVKHYILCYDNDAAGEKGTKRFLDFVRKDVFVDIVQMPQGKDVADLTKEQFISLLS